MMKEADVSPVNRVFNLVVILILGALGGGSFLCAGVTLATAVSGDDSFQMLPLFIGFTLACLGGIVLTFGRERLHVSGIPFVVSLVLWIMGATTFAFGLTATLMFDEPADFMPNLGFALSLCLAPGGFLALLGLLLYGYEARRNRPTAVAEPDAPDWI